VTRTRRTPYTILGCLTVRPMSAYDIKQFLDRTVAHFWSESYGQIYPTLRQLERDALIVGRQTAGERGRDKRVYRITAAGRERLRNWLKEPAEPVTPRYEHSLKVFFGYNVDPTVSLQHVQRLRQQMAESLAAYRETERELERRAAEDTTSRAVHWLAVLRGGLRYAEAVVRWCDETQELLGSRLEMDGPSQGNH